MDGQFLKLPIFFLSHEICEYLAQNVNYFRTHSSKVSFGLKSVYLIKRKFGSNSCVSSLSINIPFVRQNKSIYDVCLSKQINATFQSLTDIFRKQTYNIPELKNIEPGLSYCLLRDIPHNLYNNGSIFFFGTM